MTVFIDGPAQNNGEWIAGSRPLRRAPSTPLLLKRAPHYLRAVLGPAGELDALDQLDDSPKAEETVVAYEMVGEPTICHINSGRRHGGSGFFRGGRYRVVAEQPTDEQLRSTVAWRAWVSERIGRPVAADGTAVPQ